MWHRTYLYLLLNAWCAPFTVDRGGVLVRAVTEEQEKRKGDVQSYPGTPCVCMSCSHTDFTWVGGGINSRGLLVVVSEVVREDENEGVPCCNQSCRVQYSVKTHAVVTQVRSSVEKVT